MNAAGMRFVAINSRRVGYFEVEGRLTANQSKTAISLGSWAVQCASCVPDLGLIWTATALVAPFPPGLFESPPDRAPPAGRRCGRRAWEKLCFKRVSLLPGFDRSPYGSLCRTLRPGCKKTVLCLRTNSRKTAYQYTFLRILHAKP